MVDRKRVAFYTLGCKVNSAETDVLETAMKSRGYRTVEFGDEADVYVLNTCTVTGQAGAQCRQAIRRAKKLSPGAMIAVIGCYSQADPDTVAAIEGVDLILGTRERFRLLEYIDNFPCDGNQVINTGMGADPFADEKDLLYGTERTRAFLKVQDGCSYTCTYCIIPDVRGESLSRDRNDVIDRAVQMRDAGFNEIVLTAVNLGDYRYSSVYGLYELLNELCEVPDLPRIRLTSIEPNLITAEIVKLIADSGRICRHFHVPMQSGSDEALKMMKRRYRTAKYREVLDMIMEFCPEASIGADVMTGFPGETAEHFRETYRFIETLPVSYLHVFKYSPRPGTPAADNLHLQQDHRTISEQSRQLIELGLAKKERFLENQLGKEALVLYENLQEDGCHYGFTENYARVRCRGENLENRLVNVKLTSRDGFVLDGSPVLQKSA